MSVAIQKRLGNSRQRGFWLRCFLGRTVIFLALVICMCRSVSANECKFRPIYVRNLQGHVLYATVEDARGVKLTVRNAAKTVLQSTTDERGDFRMKVPRGEYDLVAEAQGFAPSSAHIHVGFGLRSLFHQSVIQLRLDVTRVC